MPVSTSAASQAKEFPSQFKQHKVLTSLFAMNSINKFITFFGSVGLVGFGLTRLDSVFESMADRYEWRDA